MKKRHADPIVSRKTACADVKRMLTNYAEGLASQSSGECVSAHSTEPAKNIAVISDAGLAGKTTFLLEDVRPLMDADRGGLLSERFAWVYVACDIDADSRSKAAVLFELCRGLERAGFAVPTAKSALVRYNILMGNGLAIRFGEAWRTFSGAVAAASTGFFVAKYLTYALSDVLASIPIDDPLLAVIVRGITLFRQQLEGMAGGLSDLDAAAGIIQGAAVQVVRVASDCLGGLDFSPIFNSLDAEQLLESLETALELDLACNQGRIPCIAIDGLEGLTRSTGDARVPWLNRLTACNGAFFILAGREEPRGLRTGKFKVVGLDRIDARGFAAMLGSRVVLNPDDRRLAEMASGLPGLLAMYAEGKREGIWARGFRKRIFSSGGSRRDAERRVGPVWRRRAADVESVARAIVGEYATALKDMRGGMGWQLIAVLSWIPEWDTRRLARAMLTGGAYSEYIGNIRDFVFVQPIEEGERSFRIHPAVAVYVRELTSPETRDAVEVSFRQVLNDKTVDAKTALLAISTLIGLDVHKAYDAVSRMTGVEARFAPTLDDGEIRVFLASAADAITGAFDTQERAAALTDFYAAVEDIYNQLSARSDRLRKSDPKGALAAGELALEVADYLRERRTKVRGSPVGSAAAVKKSEIARADALRKVGAVYSDQYRNSSDISFHVRALRYEIEALQVIAKTVGGTPARIAPTDDADAFAGALNSVGTSSMRLKRYDVALPVLSIAKCFIDVPDNKVSDRITGFIQNNYAVCRYDYCVDCCTAGVAYVHAGDIGLTPGGELACSRALNEAIGAYESQFAACAKKGQDPKWDPLANYAECLRRSGRLDDAQRALEQLDGYLGEGNRSNYRARYCIVLARLELQKAREAIVSGDTDNAAKSFEAARKAAVDSLEIKIKVKGPEHLDARKADELVREIDAAIDGSNLGAAEIGRLKAVEEDRCKKCREQLSARLAPVELAGRIVRGDGVRLPDLFGIGVGEFERRFGADELTEG